ncbi:MAG: hypothetical protein ACYCZA_04215 [Thiobacillus sp.]
MIPTDFRTADKPVMANRCMEISSGKQEAIGIHAFPHASCSPHSRSPDKKLEQKESV